MIAFLLAAAVSPALMTLTADFDGDGLADTATFERVQVQNADRRDKIYGIVVRRGATPKDKRVVGLGTQVSGLKFQPASLRADCATDGKTVVAGCISTESGAVNGFLVLQQGRAPYLVHWTGSDFKIKDVVL